MKKTFVFLTVLLTLPIVCSEETVARWSFKNASLDDDAGKFKMAAQGKTVIVNDAEKGPCLELGKGGFPYPEGIKTTRVYKELTPPGAFRLEMDFKLKPDAAANDKDKIMMVLWDSKGIFWPKASDGVNSHSGFTVALQKKDTFWQPMLYLGYGGSSITLPGITKALNDGKWHHLEFIFDPRGRAVVKLDGQANIDKETKTGALGPAVRPTAIGDRTLRNYFGFEGYLANIALYATPMPPLTVESIGRGVFEHGESGGAMTLRIANFSGNILNPVEISGKLAGIDLKANADALENGKRTDVPIPVPTRLRPGKYTAEFTVSGGNRQQKISQEIIIVEKRGDYMPVFMWQSGNLDKIAAIGFTHYLDTISNSFMAPDTPPDTKYEAWRKIDKSMAAGLLVCDLFMIARYKPLLNRFPRLDRAGKTYSHANLEASNPELQKITAETADRAARAYASHPGFGMLLANTEVRDGSNPSFVKSEPQAFKEFAGYDIPAEATNRNCPRYPFLHDFPVSKVIEEDYPLYVFYKWWWKEGDGWNNLHSIIAGQYRKYVSPDRPDYMSFYDPAVRVPPVWGSGGTVDAIEQWTYSYPDPLKIAAATDELRAMAAGRPDQKLIKMTQAIWYRSATAPVGTKIDTPPAWVKEFPDTFYISCAPDHLLETFWSKISRRLDGIAYHGYGSLVEVDNAPWNKYPLTNTETRDVLQKLIDGVVKPLGPVLKRIPERKPEVVILQSFTSNLFAMTGSWGWGWGWDSELHLALQWARLDPAIIYDEAILRDKLDGVKVLVLPWCEVMTRPVVNEILAFQQRGGLVVADEKLVPEILPDIQVKYFFRSRNAKVGKSQVQNLGLSIRKELEPFYRAYADSSSPDLIPHVRASGKADYLFTVNDHRDFGDYVGMYGRVMEKGLPLSGTVSVRRGDTNAVYNLATHREVPFTVRNGQTQIKVDFQTCDGRLFLILPEKIHSMNADIPASSSISSPFDLTVSVLNDRDQPIGAVVPLEIRIADSSGNPVTGSGYYAAEDGRLKIQIVPALNDRPGVWDIEIRELASDKSLRRRITME